MNYRTLGRTGVKVSPLCLGAMMFGAWGTREHDEGVRIIHRALDAGINFIDTADVYSNGESEEIVGKALADIDREHIVLATKVHGVMGRDPNAQGNSRRWILAECENSLRRLGTDYIDLYQIHRPSPDTDIDETLGALTDLVHAGKVRYIGLSEAAPATIRRAHRVHPIAALQSEYSLWWREPESTVLPVCRELGIGVVPFSPLGRGFLSGQVAGTDGLAADDLRRRLPRFQGENLRHNLALVTRLEEIAARKGCSPSQLALAWLLARGPDIVPIPGTKRRAYLESNAAAVELELTDQEVSALDTAFPPDAASGERYAPDMMRWLDKTPARPTA
jgi:aryl-alcohol dehydrogenase-like predicted oxidoreductase